jgi:hypothetical protein
MAGEVFWAGFFHEAGLRLASALDGRLEYLYSVTLVSHLGVAVTRGVVIMLVRVFNYCLTDGSPLTYIVTCIAI